LQTETASVIEQRSLGGDYRVLEFASSKVAPRVKPGQFIHLRVDERNELVLRRPFSVFKTGKKSLAILYKIVGRGTQILARLRPGDRAGIMGPLGNGFPLPASQTFPLLAAGGYGAAALYLLAQQARKKGIIFIGGATADDILCADDFKKIGWKVKIATEDGAAGQKGLATDILTEYLSEKSKMRQMALYACGPMGMLKAVAEIAVKNGQKAWLSLDRRMGCGVGACLGCVQKVKDGKSWKWARVCRDGPVFECRQIVWENGKWEKEK
jgi:dihydroorotate dehydrogenase electron transfer subunit